MIEVQLIDDSRQRVAMIQVGAGQLSLEPSTAPAPLPAVVAELSGRTLSLRRSRDVDELFGHRREYRLDAIRPGDPDWSRAAIDALAHDPRLSHWTILVAVAP